MKQFFIITFMLLLTFVSFGPDDGMFRNRLLPKIDLSEVKNYTTKEEEPVEEKSSWFNLDFSANEKTPEEKLEESTVDIRNLEMTISNFGSARLPVKNTVFLCSGHGCAFLNKFNFNTELRQIRSKVRAWSAEGERKGIADAIAFMETETAKEIGYEDTAGSGFLTNGRRQHMNSTDEAINTTSYLIIMANNGYLKYHNVANLEYTLMGGYKAAIVEKSTGDIYTIDSGYSDQGGEVLIEKKE